MALIAPVANSAPKPKETQPEESAAADSQVDKAAVHGQAGPDHQAVAAALGLSGGKLQPLPDSHVLSR